MHEDAEDAGPIPGLGRSPGEGNRHTLQYACLGDPMDSGAWGLQSMGSQRVGHDWATEHTRTQWVLPLAQDFAFKGISNQVLYLITRH